MALPTLAPTDIANLVFTRLGVSQVQNVETSSNDNARTYNRLYPLMVEAVLAEHFWNFATARKTLEATQDTPLYGFSHAFSLPSDMVRLISTNLEDYIDFKVERSFLYTNKDTVNITYVSREVAEDPTTWDILFLEALVAKIAFEMVLATTQNEQLKNDLYVEYQEKLKRARNVDSRSMSSPRVDTINTIVRAGGFVRRRPR